MAVPQKGVVGEARMTRDNIKPTRNPNGSLTYRVEALEGQIAANTVGKNSDGSYWAAIEFWKGVRPRAMRWDCPHWRELLAGVDQKRVEYHCPLFPIEEPTAGHW